MEEKTLLEELRKSQEKEGFSIWNVWALILLISIVLAYLNAAPLTLRGFGLDALNNILVSTIVMLFWSAAVEAINKRKNKE